MITRTKRTAPAEVSALLKRIEDWRQSRTKRGPMPEVLWSEAAKLGREYGVSLVSRHLKLDFHGLKRRVLAFGDGAIAERSGFVELRYADIPVLPTHGGGFVTEMEICRPGEVTVRLRQSGPLGVDMVGVIGRCFGTN
jgi:hypothetical protein